MDKKKSSPKTKTGGGFGGMSSSSSTKDSFPYAGSIRPGVQSPQRIVLDENVVKPDYYQDGIPKKGSGSPLLPWMIEVKTPVEIEKMRASGKLARQILDLAGRAVQVGITTDAIDALVHEAIVKVRGTSLFRGCVRGCMNVVAGNLFLVCSRRCNFDGGCVYLTIFISFSVFLSEPGVYLVILLLLRSGHL
jgi:hypothetical protein